MADVSSVLVRKAAAVGRRLRREPDSPVRLAGAPRAAAEQRTFLGPVMDAAVARTRRSMRASGSDPDYDLAYEHFDLIHFLQQARHLLDADGVDPLETFLGNGARAKASPDINFDMRAYLARHPERAHGPERSPWLTWLKRGRCAGEIADPAPGVDAMATVLGLAPGDLVAHLASVRTDLQERLRSGTLGEMVARASAVEPLIGEVWNATTRPVIPPLTSATVVDQIAAIHAAQATARFAPARLVLVAGDPRWGCGRRAEGHLAHALTAGHLAPDDIVVIYTDAGGQAPPGRFPTGVREIDLAAAVDGLEPAAAQRVLVELVRSLRADSVLVINSRLCYEAMAAHGAALAASERVFLVMFGNEQLATGAWVGIPLRFFYRCIDLVEGVITDSEWLADWLRDRHQLPADDPRIHVLRAPVTPTIPVAAAPPAQPVRRREVFWAARWDRQKRPDLALEIARRMPDVTLRMWGEPVLTAGQVRDVPANVVLEGRYDRFADLPLDAADGWLYTSAWDGVPGQLLEVAMTGVPIVGSRVGGTGEVLHPEGAWPVTEPDEPDAYVTAIREVLADPIGARARAAWLRDRLIADRTSTAYAAQAAGLLLTGRRESAR